LRALQVRNSVPEKGDVTNDVIDDVIYVRDVMFLDVTFCIVLIRGITTHVL